MTQFRIDVVVDPRKGVAGTKAVGRGLDDLQKKANKTQALLRRSIAFVGAGVAVRELARLGDAFTNLQNRLRVVTTGQAELASVTDDLLQVANRSRSSFESTAELYSRLSLATRELNLEGANLIEITESINKAIILSGASAKEANNGLIQLSQGLASGRLTGDELRSTLEQLPVVADVIAKRLGVTRGELRALGAAGKITSIEIIKAFQDARNELEEKFAKTIPTLSQSFVVLRNNVVAFVGSVNEGAGILRGLGAALRFVGEEIDFVVKGIGLLGASLLVIKFAPATQGFFNIQKAVAAGTAVRLGSIKAINLQNAALATNAAAAVASAAAELKRTDAIILQTQLESFSNAIKKGGNALLFEKAVLERQLGAIQAQRAGQLATLIAAEKAQGIAAATSAKQVTALSLATGKAQAGVKALTAAIASNPVGALVVGFVAAASALVFFRNEIKLTQDGTGTLNDLFLEFFSQLRMALSGVSQFFREAFGGAFSVVVDFISDFNFQFRDILIFPAVVLDSLIAIFVVTFNVIIEIFANLPAALGSIFIQAINGIITAVEFLPDVFIGVLKTIGQVIDIFITGQIRAFQLLGESAKQALLGNFEAAAAAAEEAAFVTANSFQRATEGIGERFSNNIAGEIEDEFIPRIDNIFDGAAGTLGDRVAAAFTGGLESAPVQQFVEGLLAGAETRGQDREGADAATAQAEADLAGSAAAARAEAIEKLVGQIERQNAALMRSVALGVREGEIQTQLADIKAKLIEKEIELGAAEEMALERTLRSNRSLQEGLALRATLITTEEMLAERTRIAAEAQANGVITAEQYSQELRNIDLAAARAGKSIGDGLTRGLAKATEQMSDLASAAENALVGAFNSAEDALVDFVTTGQIDFKKFAQSLIADIARIIAKTLLLKAIEAIGGLGGAAAGAAGAGSEATAAASGSPAARANKPFLIGEEGPEIFTPGQTGSITPTDQTIEALTGGAANSKETVVVQAPAPVVNVNTIIVDDPDKIPSGIESPDGQQAVLNVINQNRSAVKRNIG